MEETIVFIDSKNRALQVIINNALLSLQIFMQIYKLNQGVVNLVYQEKLKQEMSLKGSAKCAIHYPFTEHC